MRSECSGVRAGTFLGVCDLLLVTLYNNAIHVYTCMFFMFFLCHQEMQTCIMREGYALPSAFHCVCGRMIAQQEPDEI